MSSCTGLNRGLSQSLLVCFASHLVDLIILPGSVDTIDSKHLHRVLIVVLVLLAVPTWYDLMIVI